MPFPSPVRLHMREGLSGSPSGVRIDDTFGSFLIGTFIGVFLYGVTIHQVYRYFRAYNMSDPIGNKLLVCALTVLETLHTIICTHASYFYLVTSFGEPEALTRGVWSINLLTGLSGVIIIAGQSYFARRVYLIGTPYRFLVAAAVVMLVGELCLFVAATVEAFVYPEFTHFQKYTWLISAGAAMAGVADGLLTGALVVFLRRSSAGLKRMDTVVDIIILYAISTGLLTGIVNFLSFIFSLLCPSKLVYASSGIICSKLYVNSLLAALNARRYLGERAVYEISPSAVINLRASRPQPFDMSRSSVICHHCQTPVRSPITPRSARISSPLET